MALDTFLPDMDLGKYAAFLQGINLLYLKIAYLTLLLLFIFWVIWKMYMALSMRDLFRVKNPREAKGATFLDYLSYWLKYILLFPALTFIWYVIFVFLLKLITQDFELHEIMTFGIIFISAIRAASYIHKKMAEDLAKLLPLSVLVLFVQNPTFITIKLSIADITSFVALLPGFWQYLLFIIGLEFFLKLLHFIFVSLREA